MVQEVWLAGLLVGVLGILFSFIAQAGEHRFLGHARAFVERYPQSRPPGFRRGRARGGSALLTLLTGVAFAWVYVMARGGVGSSDPWWGAWFGLICWVGFVAPQQVGLQLFVNMPRSVVWASLIAFFLQLVVGGLLLGKIL